MSKNWYIEVRTNRQPSRKSEKWGSEVTVRVDRDVYAQARLRKAIATALKRGYVLSEATQADLVVQYLYEADAKNKKLSK